MGVLGTAVDSPAIVYTEGSSTRKWRYSWTTWEAEGRREGIHAPRATTCIRSFYKGCSYVFVQPCFAPQTRRGCVLIYVWSVYARTLRVKTSFRGLAAHAYLEFAYETLSLDPRAAFLKFLFTDRNWLRIGWYFHIWNNNCNQNFSFSSNFLEVSKNYSMILRHV